MNELKLRGKADRANGNPGLLLGGGAVLALWVLACVLLVELTRGNSAVLDGVALGLSLVAAALAAGALFLQSRARGEAAPAPALENQGRITMKSLDYLVSLLNVSRAVSAGTSVKDLGQVIVNSCLDCFDCHEASIMTLDHSTNELAVTAFAGYKDTSVIRRARVKVGEGVAGMVAKNRTPLILGPRVPKEKFPGFKEKQRRIQSSMVAPIVVRGRVEGVLNVSTGSDSVKYTEDDLRVLCILAEHAGIVAAKARDQERVMRLIRRIRRRGLRPPSSRTDAAAGASTPDEDDSSRRAA